MPSSYKEVMPPSHLNYGTEADKWQKLHASRAIETIDLDVLMYICILLVYYITFYITSMLAIPPNTV